MTTSNTDSPRSLGTRGEILAWATYDWANSAYSTICITILVAYILVVLPGKPGYVAYGYGIGITTFFAAMLSPTLGAVADAYRNKRMWLTIMAATGATAMVLMGLMPSDQPWLVVACFVVANLAYEVGWSVYNGFLPEISDESTVDRVSAWGFGLGYVGGGLALALAIVVIQFGGSLGLPDVPAPADRPTYPALAIDYVAARDATFAVQLPNGNYRVTLLAGDAGGPRRQMAWMLQGERIGPVSTTPEEFYEESFPVQVSNDRLELKLAAAGEDDAVINAMTVESESGDYSETFDFGTAGSSAADEAIWVGPADAFGEHDLAKDKDLDERPPMSFGWESGQRSAADAVYPLRMRIGLVMTGLWWGLFSLPILIVLKDRGVRTAEPQPVYRAAVAAMQQVLTTLRNVRRYKMLFVFLIGYLLFNDGVQTVISQASVFAIEVLQMGSGELALVVLMIQFVALPGTLLVSKSSNWIGQKRSLMICLALWVALLVAAFFVTTTRQFWIMAFVLSLIMGGTQSVSRAMMGVMTPAHRSAEFFGFFNFSGRATSMLGPVFFSTVLASTDSAHLAILSLLIFFLLGWFFVTLVDMRRGREEAQAASE